MNRVTRWQYKGIYGNAVIMNRKRIQCKSVILGVKHLLFSPRDCVQYVMCLHADGATHGSCCTAVGPQQVK